MPVRDLTEEETSRLLTQEKVDNLPNGTRVMVKWSGGNGPHEYLVDHRHGEVYGCCAQPGRGSSLTPVGTHRAQNRVFLPIQEAPAAEPVQGPESGRLDTEHFRKASLASPIISDLCDEIDRLLPAQIVYLAAIRLAAHATTGKYGQTEVPKLTAMDALGRWRKDHWGWT